MKKLALTCSLLALLGAGLVAPAAAQTPPPPAAPADGANSHAKLEAALQQINLRPRQKIEIMKIVKAAKASGQDKKVTLEQIGGVLDADQKAQLMSLLKAAEASK